MATTRRVLVTDLRFEQSLAKWKRLDPTLKALAVMASAVSIGCSWCVDFGYWESTNRGIDPVKMRDVPALAGQRRLHRLERKVMAYAEAVTATPPAVTDEMVDRPAARTGRRGAGRADHDGRRGEHPVRFNSSLGLTSQGFKDRCQLRTPATSREHRPGRASTSTGGCCSARRTRCWAASRTPRTSCRTRGCAGPAADREAVADPRAYLRPDHHPARPRPAALGPRPPGELRRALAARTAR